MHTLRIAALAALFALPLAAAPPPAPASATPAARPAVAPPAAPVPEQLAHLNATLEHISQLLERQLDGQKLELLLRRVEIGNRRVTSLEQELERADGDKRAMEDQRYRLRAQIDSMTQELQAMSPSELEEKRQEYRHRLQNAQTELNVIDVRHQEATQRVLDLQNELEGRKHDLQGLKDLLDRQLLGQ